MKRLFFLTTASTLFFVSCNSNGNSHDASGTFEADEVVVSSSANGKIIYFNLDEGSVLAKDSVVALVDPTGLTLQKEEVEATIQALGQQTLDVNPQVTLLNNQLSVQQSYTWVCPSW